MKKFADLAGLKGSRRPKFFNHFGNPKDQPLSLPLIRSITAALSESIPGIREKINLLVNDEHAITTEAVDLLQGSYMDLTHSPLEFQWRTENGYFRSYNQESSFRVICDPACALQIVLTYRLFKSDVTERTIQLLVNGAIAADFVASTRWQTWQGTISQELFHRGVNYIAVHWPEQPTQTRTERTKELIQNLESVRLWQDVNDLYSVYGEIHEFRAQPA
jgi:hypothetical protein